MWLLFVAERLLLAQGFAVELVPGGFRQFAPILARFAPRVMVAQAAPGDLGGTVNLSLHLGATRNELLRAGRDPDRLLIVEVNPNLPRTMSLPPTFDNTIAIEDIDVIIEHDGAPFELTDPRSMTSTGRSPTTRLISSRRVRRCRRGSGPSRTSSLQSSRPARSSEFGVHSEMFTNGLMRLHQAGKVTNRHKGIFEGVSVTTFALGTAELYRWIDRNNEVAFLDVDVVNDPTVIAQNSNLVSINGALSVDLYGQVVADNVEGKQISGVGGHEDFVWPRQDAP